MVSFGNSHGHSASEASFMGFRRAQFFTECWIRPADNGLFDVLTSAAPGALPYSDGAALFCARL